MEPTDFIYVLSGSTFIAAVFRRVNNDLTVFMPNLLREILEYITLIILEHSNGVGSWNPSLWKTMTHLSCMTQCMTLNIFKDSHSGYLNLKNYSPIKFTMYMMYFSDIE